MRGDGFCLCLLDDRRDHGLWLSFNLGHQRRGFLFEFVSRGEVLVGTQVADERLNFTLAFLL